MRHFRPFRFAYLCNMIPLMYDKEKWWTVEAHSIEVQGISLTIPKNFDTDLASIPRIFWAIYPPFGRYMRAAIVHDYLYRKTTFSEPLCDRIFYVLMKKDGVDLFTRFIFYSIVRTFGCRSKSKS